MGHKHAIQRYAERNDEHISIDPPKDLADVKSVSLYNTFAIPRDP
jgi:hypothetical protein